MQDAVGDENVRLDNLRRVDVLVVPCDAYRDLLAGAALAVSLGQSGELRAIGERRRDDDLVGHDVVAHDASELLRIQLLQSATDERKGFILRRKDSHVLAICKVRHKLGGVERAQER